jgi:hypothetical protein
VYKSIVNGNKERELFIVICSGTLIDGMLLPQYQLRCWGPLMVAQWLRYCATNPKFAGSIPDGVIEFFH